MGIGRRTPAVRQRLRHFVKLLVMNVSNDPGTQQIEVPFEGERVFGWAARRGVRRANVRWRESLTAIRQRRAAYSAARRRPLHAQRGFRGGWCGNVEMPPDTSHPRRCWAFAAAVELRFLGRFRDRIEDQLVGVTGSGECRHQSPDPTAVR